ncbi:MAG: class I SAM-dependent methyltransferase [Actinomycetota bacterium]
MKIFDLIAPAYGLFYGYQKRHFNEVLDGVQNELDFSIYSNIIDIGCGTGAFCSVLHQRGFVVTGTDNSQKMLHIAAKKQENKAIEFVHANVLDRLPFGDKSFDVSFTSYVAHGLKPEERKIMYKEMSRITKRLIIIHDYNEKRSVLTDIAEWLEGGDYFNFIKIVKSELKNSFYDVSEIKVDPQASWYICKPRDQYIL